MRGGADRQAEKQLVKSRVRIDELARELAGCELSPRGPNDLWACCPFHAEDTPSFHVRPGLGLYKCFGCGASGDVFSFVQQLRGIGFREALQFLAERCGVELGSLTPEERRRQTEVRRVRDALGRAAEVFARAFREGADNPARAYMLRRGFSPEVLEHFDVGWVPPDFAARLRRAGLSATQIEQAGFTRQFAGRVSFGIRDEHGALVGFGARTLQPGEKPKYVNTRETEAFNKRRLLYGLDKAARAVARSGRAIVMEGYTDVMMAHQRGLSDVVASMGTSLTADHLRLLAGRAGNLVFVFDGDAAGQDAAERAVRLALEQGRECRVLALPEDADPCDWFAGHGPDDFEALLAEQGSSTVTFLCQRVLGRLDVHLPGRHEKAAREVHDLTAPITDPVRRDGIAAEIARLCRVDRNLLAPRVDLAAGRARSGRASARSVNVWVRSQYVAVGGLAAEAGCRAQLDELVRLGALTHPGALRLRELALQLDGDPVDPIEWVERVREHEPALLPHLERLLFPGPDVVLPAWSDAVRQLRDKRLDDLEREARRAAISRPGIDSDEAALRALHQSLRSRHDAAGRSTNRNGPASRTADGAPDTTLKTRHEKEEL